VVLGVRGAVLENREATTWKAQFQFDLFGSYYDVSFEKRIPMESHHCQQK
jgi:hypothetical protein